MPQFKRHKRLKRISSKQKFGVRYLHQHLFKEDPTSEEESAIEDSHQIPQKADGRLCFVRAISGIMLLAGVVLALVGGLVKRREVDYRVHQNGDETPVGDAVQFNSMLDAFVLMGSVLMMLGGVMFAAVQILICYPRRKTSTRKPRVEDPESFLYPEKTSESEVASKKFDKVPVYALVRKVQPKKKDGNKKDRTSLMKKHKSKSSIDEDERQE